jgi:hypothetical protein
VGFSPPSIAIVTALRKTIENMRPQAGHHPRLLKLHRVGVKRAPLIRENANNASGRLRRAVFV